MTMSVSFNGKSWRVLPHLPIGPGDVLSISVTSSPTNFTGTVASSVRVLVNGLDPSGPHEHNTLDDL